MSTSSQEDRNRPVLALVAHDEKKDTLTNFCVEHRQVLEHWELVGTGSTAKRISDATKLPVHAYLSGPEGGDAQIAARVALGEVGAVIFLLDPLSAHPHDPDIQTLQRVCNVHNVPIATNLAAAELIIQPKTINEQVE
ncbi:MAG: methylglyoxal synthase [Chloroflexi bacterium]|nr:MAG: methylglyoxal synthase [Chloroflexota bacterium]